MSVNVAPPRRQPSLARVVDVALAAVTLALTAPLLAAIALAVLACDGRPVLFAQERLGLRGVPFRLRKFRTLAGVSGGEPIAPSNDARATPLGRWLRRWHLDELPQLVEVLRGRMALVGPRPEVPVNLTAVDSEALARLQSVRPGLTGPTQLAFLAEDDVLAECDDPLQAYRRVLVPAKVEHDLAWLARRSLLSDLVVLVRTPFVLTSRRARARSRRLVAARLGRAPTIPAPRA